MDNYLLMSHILKCRVVPKSEVHPELWIGADKKFKKVPMARVYRVSHKWFYLTLSRS
jgi:nucleolar protein 15